MKPATVSVRLMSQIPRKIEAPKPVLTAAKSVTQKTTETKDTSSVDTLATEIPAEESDVASEVNVLEIPLKSELVSSQEADVDAALEDTALTSRRGLKRSAEIRLPLVLIVQPSQQKYGCPNANQLLLLSL